MTFRGDILAKFAGEEEGDGHTREGGRRGEWEVQDVGRSVGRGPLWRSRSLEEGKLTSEGGRGLLANTTRRPRPSSCDKIACRGDGGVDGSMAPSSALSRPLSRTMEIT